MDVLVLSTGFEPMYLIEWDKAIVHVFTGRAEILKHFDDRFIGTVSGPIQMPAVVRFKDGVFLNRWNKNRRLVKLNRKNLWLRDNGTCQYCGCITTIKSYQIEHVIPKSREGGTCWKNVVVACSKCNQKKGARTPHEAGMKLLKTPRAPDIRHLVSNEVLEFKEKWGY